MYLFLAVTSNIIQIRLVEAIVNKIKIESMTKWGTWEWTLLFLLLHITWARYVKFKKQENIKNSILHIVICLSVQGSNLLEISL